MSGGIRLICDARGDCHLLGARPGQELHFNRGDRKFGATLWGYPSIRTLARVRVYDDADIYDPISDGFALFAWAPEGKCIAYHQERYWQGVRDELVKEKKFVEAAMVSRFVTQLRKTKTRFEKLFGAYVAAHDSGQVLPLKSDSIAISNKYTSNIEDEFASLLDDLVNLRDAINTIVYRMVYAFDGSFATTKLRSKISASPSSDLRDYIINSMFDEESGDYLLANMATYRAVASHCMGHVNPVTGGSILEKKSDGPLGTLSRIVLPLYDDMAALKEIERETPKGFAFTRELEDYKRFMKLDNHVDALDFGFDCLVRLLEISRLAGIQGGFRSELLTITDKDIIEGEMTNEKGERVRWKRDRDTIIETKVD